MHISTANIRKTVAEVPNIAIAIKWDVCNWLSISVFTFNIEPFNDHSEIDCEKKSKTFSYCISPCISVYADPILLHEEAT